MHPRRRRRTSELQQLGGEGRSVELYRRLMLWEFGREARMGWQLALLRPFMSPRMARILAESGHFQQRPVKRTYDTGLLIYELVFAGPESERGRAVISRMNTAHRQWTIAPADMTYVLCSFIVVAFRYIDRTGWRSLTDLERAAGVAYWRRIGQMMNIDRLPEDYADAARIVDDYERDHIGPSPEGIALGKVLLATLRGRVPAPARPLTALIFACELGDDRLARAIGLPPAPRAVKGLAFGVGRVWARVNSLRKPRTAPVFTPGQRAGSIYPEGYRFSQLGVSRE